MKKIISLALIVCMLLSIALPLSVSAAYSTDGSDGKTSRFFYKQSNTGLDAYPGTPTIDGKWTDGEDWSNALPLTMNSTTKALIDNCGISSAYNGEFYLLWDENNLYIMEVQRNWWTKVQTYAGVQASGKDRPWNSWGTAIYVLPTRTFSLNTCKVYGMFIWETSSGADGVTLNAGDTCSALITERYATYSSWPGAVSGGGYGTISSNIDGVNAVFGKTGGSAYVMETSISWDYLGMSAPNANTTTDIVDALGVKLGMGANGGSHLQGNTSMNSGEFTGFDPITLKAEAFNKIDTAKAEAYWTDETNGQFVKNATATEYEISTAEQLLGLSLAMENNANDNTWTEGKTFKLTADIDLNPGVDWAAYKTAVAEGKTDVTSLNYNK